jgi:hypothetical protein
MAIRGPMGSSRTLEALIAYQQDLGLIAAPVNVDDLFVPTYG